MTWRVVYLALSAAEAVGRVGGGGSDHSDAVTRTRAWLKEQAFMESLCQHFLVVDTSCMGSLLAKQTRIQKHHPINCLGACRQTIELESRTCRANHIHRATLTRRRSGSLPRDKDKQYGRRKRNNNHETPCSSTLKPRHLVPSISRKHAL